MLNARTFAKYTRTLLPPVLVALIVLLIGNTLGDDLVSMGVLYVLTVVLLVAATCMFIEFNRACVVISRGCPNVAKFSIAASHCRIMEDIDKNGAVWCITTDDLLEAERNTEAKTVLIWTPEVTMDTEDKFIRTIVGNMGRGVSYIYHVPATLDAQREIDKFKTLLRKRFPAYEQYLVVWYMPEMLIVNGMTIHKESEEKGQGFVNIPHQEFETKYFVSMDADFVARNLRCITWMAEKVGKQRP